MDHMETRDVYIKLTDPTGRHKTIINHHRVWGDGADFIESQIRQHTRQANPDEVRVVSEATKAEYQAARQPR